MEEVGLVAWKSLLTSEGSSSHLLVSLNKGYSFQGLAWQGLVIGLGHSEYRCSGLCVN